jgi:hypothetical protein
MWRGQGTERTSRSVYRRLSSWGVSTISTNLHSARLLGFVQHRRMFDMRGRDTRVCFPRSEVLTQLLHYLLIYIFIGQKIESGLRKNLQNDWLARCVTLFPTEIICCDSWSLKSLFHALKDSIAVLVLRIICVIFLSVAWCDVMWCGVMCVMWCGVMWWTSLSGLYRYDNSTILDSVLRCHFSIARRIEQLTRWLTHNARVVHNYISVLSVY